MSSSRIRPATVHLRVRHPDARESSLGRRHFWAGSRAAFGLLFRSTPVAIVVYFAAPTAWSILTSTVSALAGTGRWLDPSTACTARSAPDLDG